jgi:hypothetical protein
MSGVAQVWACERDFLLRLGFLLCLLFLDFPQQLALQQVSDQMGVKVNAKKDAAIEAARKANKKREYRAEGKRDKIREAKKFKRS